jgi:hypothetical protein
MTMNQDHVETKYNKYLFLQISYIVPSISPTHTLCCTNIVEIDIVIAPSSDPLFFLLVAWEFH